MMVGFSRAWFLLMALCSVNLFIAAGQERKTLPTKPLDLNQATSEQLQQLPGIGPVTAKAIVRFREKSGPFRRVEDLLAVRGISKRKLEKLRPYVTVRRDHSRSNYFHYSRWSAGKAFGA